MNILRAGLFSIIFLFIATSVHAEDDWQYWSVYNLKHKVNDEVSVFINPEFWLQDDISQLFFWRSRQGIVYKLTDHVSFGQNYLYARKKSAVGKWTTEQGLESDFFVNWKLDEFSFSNRLRLEHRNIEFETKYRYRNQLKVSKNVELLGQPLKAYIFDEMFYDEEDNSFNQNRVGIGVVKKINDSTSLDLGWWYRTDRTGEDWKGTAIIRTNLSISF